MAADSQSDSEKNIPVPLTCPAKISHCSIIEELARLRQSLEQLSEQVRTDPLTQLANYRFFCSALEQEMERTQRSGQPTALIMLDIDHFKQVNDTWGHEVGNQALVHIAKLMLQTVRKLDIPCRYGGEEFAIILPNTELSASIPVAERLRQQIAETPLPLEEGQLSMTASLGIAIFKPENEATLEELVHSADQYLYQAKQDGRNLVRHAELPEVDVVSRDEKDTLFDLFGSGSQKRKKKPGEPQ